jgi:hypothetical protein
MSCNENPYQSPTTVTVTQPPARRIHAAWLAMRGGAKWGFVVVAVIAATVGILGWTALIIVERPTPMEVLHIIVGLLVGVIAYAAAGAILGAIFMGMVAAFRWKPEESCDAIQQNTRGTSGNNPGTPST